MKSKRPAITGLDKTASIERLLTVAEAARWLRCSPSMIYKLLRSRDLHGIHIGRTTRFEPDELRNYLESAGRTGLIGEASPGSAEDAGSQASEKDLIQFVQSVKGAPASVLLALGWAGRALSHKELLLWTRCGHDQITLALRSLVRLGWVTGRTSRGPWRLAKGHAIPAAFTPAEASALKARSSSDESLRDSQSSSEEPLPSNARREQLMLALRDCGIWEPTASRLAELPHVTPEYIRAHAAQARAEGLRIGAAITRIELGSPVPPSREEQADTRQEEIAEKIRRFIQG